MPEKFIGWGPPFSFCILVTVHSISHSASLGISLMTNYTTITTKTAYTECSTYTLRKSIRWTPEEARLRNTEFILTVTHLHVRDR